MSKGFVSFAEVKQSVTMEAVLTHYGLFGDLTSKGKNLAGACPLCKGKSARQFQVNTVKNAWYCFGCKTGGNILDFVAKKEGVSVRTAALRLDSWFELGLAEETSRAVVEAPAAPAEPPPAASVEAPPAVTDLPTENPPLTFTLKTLDPHHESLAPLGLRAETIERFGAGYCAKGLLKGRMAIPIHSPTGELLAYAGLAVEDGETPRYLFPPKFHPPFDVFNLHRLAEVFGDDEDDPLYIAPEIEGVLQLFEAGFTSALGLFDGTLSPEQEEALTGALSFHEGFLLVGEGFENRTVARLARHASVSWIPEVPTSPLMRSRWKD
jgi:DNA primase